MSHEKLHEYLWGKNRFIVRNLAGVDYATLDLSLFNELRFNEGSASTLLVRQEYICTYDAYMEHVASAISSNTRAATLVTGQTGSGKTLFLLYVFARLLQESQVLAIQTSSRQFALYDQSGVTLHSAADGVVLPGTITLSDSFSESHEPCQAFWRFRVHLFHISSPNLRRWKYWAKHLYAWKYIMDIWTAEEFRALLILENQDIERGLTLFNNYGPFPRTLLQLLSRPNAQQEHCHELRQAAFRAAQDLRNMWDLYIFDFTDNPSSEVIVLRPKSSSMRGIPTLSIPTAFLATTLGVAVSKTEAAQQREFFMMISDRPHLRPPAEWLFKNFAHVNFVNATTNIKAYLSDDTTPHHIPPTKVSLSGNSTLRNVQEPFDFYWRPEQSNIPGIDALICSGINVWVLQYAVTPSHHSATEGLDIVYDLMNHMKNLKWRLVIVAPNLCRGSSVQDCQSLNGKWETTPVYACELPFRSFIYDSELVEAALIEDQETYPVEMGVDIQTP